MHTMRLVKTYQFEAAHRLPHVPEDHKCARLHGHSFRVEVEIEGPVDPKMGWVMDYADISALVKPIIAELDHDYLNEIPGLENPTSENIAVWIWKRLKPGCAGLRRITIAETCLSRCEYRGEST
jgi:6-pyruvoyltetrahydropterin/6-carboxytetrahydropterin synthase